MENSREVQALRILSRRERYMKPPIQFPDPEEEFLVTIAGETIRIRADIVVESVSPTGRTARVIDIRANQHDGLKRNKPSRASNARKS